MKNKILFFHFLVFLTAAIPTTEESSAFEIVIWDVGQGAWSTLISPGHCFHFDIGGEKIPRNVRRKFQGKRNLLSITHWDRDHIVFLPWAMRYLSGLCARSLPPGEPSKSLQHVATQARALKECTYIQTSTYLALPKIFELQSIPLLENAKTSNSGSQIFELKNIALIAGDSGTKEEKVWASRLKSCPTILVLGHHGSRTSTSERLLDQMKCLSLGIASSRRKKYGHPHADVVGRLRSRGVPVLATETWGDIHIPLPLKY